MSHNTSHNGAQVRAESTTTVEAEPADPEEDRPENHVCYIVWAVWKTVGPVVSSTPAQHEGIGKSSSTRGNMHRCAAGEVKTAELEGPAVGIPSPVSYGVIDDGCPDEDEHDSWQHPATIGRGTNGEGGTADKICQSSCRVEIPQESQDPTYVIAANMP